MTITLKLQKTALFLQPALQLPPQGGIFLLSSGGRAQPPPLPEKHKGGIQVRKVSPLALKLGLAFASFALMLGVASAGSVCAAWFHQPEVPQGMGKYIK